MGSLDFNGTTTYLRTPNGPYTGALTFVAWANWDGAGESNTGTLFSGKADVTYLRMDGASTAVRMGIEHSSVDALTRMTVGTLTAGLWYCLVGTYTPADLTCRIYHGTEYERVLESPASTVTPAASAQVATNTELYIGSESATPADTFDGRLFHAAILPWVMPLDHMERYRLGELPVLFAYGNPLLYITCSDTTALVDSSRRGGAVATTATAASSTQPRVQMSWDWRNGQRRVM